MAIEYNRRTMVYTAVFGALWGLAEATLGSLLHLLHLPLSGAVLGAVGMGIVLIARRLNPVRGSTILMALIAASIKMLSFATIKLGPFVAIVLEGALLELTLSLLGTGLAAFLTSSLIISVYPIIQSIVTKSILFGENFVPVMLELAEGFSQRIGYEAGWWVLGLYLAIHFMLAFATAGFVWQLLKRRAVESQSA